MKSTQIVHELLGGDNWSRKLIGEASVHRPRRGRIWVASFTGVQGQQWRSTGTEDHAAALVRAKEFEAVARVQRAAAGRNARTQTPGLRQKPGGSGGGLTQREIGLLLGISERAVRAIEKRALRKLTQHPDLRDLWRQYQAGELTEERQRLSVPEMNALLGLTRSQAEREALQKLMALVQSRAGGSQPAR
jgi:hypothetical protein